MFKRNSVEKRRDLGNKMDANNPQLFYEDFDDLVFKLECAINNISKIRNQKTQYLATDFDWKNMAPYYDNEYEILI